MSDFTLASLAPRPADHPAEPQYAYQRRFGSSSSDAYLGTRSLDVFSSEHCSFAMATASVYRNAREDSASLDINVGQGSVARISVQLNPAGLRDLAHRLLDAAHDIESLPASVLVKAAASTESSGS
ncbi:hypothetical protein [Variovorax paradoxus]|uniref:hypothetical protein n=1 Tax=Variovorax paradoxus TaxID=34073 RepID=UPI0012DABDBE|nr:hypothetical protein [Variovorax paradoxus]